MPKIKLIGSKPEIFAENTAWIWFQLKLHLRMISLKNSSREVRHESFDSEQNIILEHGLEKPKNIHINKSFIVRNDTLLSGGLGGNIIYWPKPTY